MNKDQCTLFVVPILIGTACSSDKHNTLSSFGEAKHGARARASW